MSSIQFTANSEDLSTDRGYQFKFFCDKCHNGHLSSFVPSVTGTVGGLMRAAGNLFGGVFGRIGSASYEMQRAVGGKAHDDAFAAAVNECKQYFKQCTRCGKWVCPDVCWNAKRQLCEECAPDLQEAAAAAQAQVAVDQAWENARKTDQTQGLDMAQEHSAACPKCHATLKAKAKFCSSCGSPVGQAAKAFCAECGGELAPGAKFCDQCGHAS